MRVAWLGDLRGHLAFEPGIIDLCESGLRTLADIGCLVEPETFDMNPERVWEAWLVWRHFLVAASLSPLLTEGAHPRNSNRELIKPEALWEIDNGLALTAPQLSHAATERTAFTQVILALFDRFDVLAIPTAQVWPFVIEQHWPDHIGERAMDTYHRWMEVTTYATFAGLPAINVPVGVDSRGRPMGMQLIGRPASDVALMRLAAAYETTLS
jgi:amidase